MRVDYQPVGSDYSPERLADNIRYAKSLGLDCIQPGDLGIPLAVVGGGPSINDHVAVLRKWSGDIWAVNGAFHWCQERGIDATFFSCDSNPDLDKLATGASRAILATICDPAVFAVLSGAYVRIFDTGKIAGIHTGPTSATSCPALGIHAGYKEITFFGCESSYSSGRTHAYHDDAPNPWTMTVQCNGNAFETEAEYHMQAIYLSQFLRCAPHVFKEMSGGLLRAMSFDENSEVITASDEFMKLLRVA